MKMLPTIAMGLLMAAAIAATGKHSTASPSTAGDYERRCGWFSNPTPGNAWLDDKDGEWIVGTQGGHQAEGDWPEFSSKQWVKTNVNYGYGCACMTLKVNHETNEVSEIKSATARPLSACRSDRSLKEPKD